MPATAGSSACATGGSSSSSPARDLVLRVSGILFACDPLGVSKFGVAEEYDRYAPEIAAIGRREDLHAYLSTHGLASLSTTRSLQHFLGLAPTVDELYPPPAREARRG